LFYAENTSRNGKRCLQKDTKKISLEGCREIDYRRLTVMQYQNSKTHFSRALTLVEMVIAMTIMAIVFAAILPQFRAIQNSWDSKQAAAETLQNSRVLMEHLYRNLSKAVKITVVSDSAETNGYIEFQDNDANSFRYDINGATSYVEFGPVGNLADLAGPVSQLQFTCYDACDLDTPITDVNPIRCVKVETTLINPGPGPDKAFTTQAYLRTNLQDEAGWTLYKMEGSEIEFDLKKCIHPALWQIDAYHYLCAYQGDGDNGWAIVFTVDTANWTITAGTPFEFDTKDGRTPALWQIDSTHYLCAYERDGSDGWAVVLTVNTGNWTITKETPFEFDPQKGKSPALSQIDTTHYLCAYQGDGDDGWAVVLTVNTGNWSISKETPIEFDNNKCIGPALSHLDSTHYLCTYQGDGDDGWAVVLTVNTSNWSISKETPLEFDNNKCIGPVLCRIDPANPQYYLCAYQGDGDDGWAVVLEVTPATYTISKETSLEFDPSQGKYVALAKMSDDEHYLCAYSGLGDDGWGVVLNVTEPPWSVTVGSSVEYDPSKAADVALCKVDDTHYLYVYRGDGDDGYAVIIWSGDEIKP